MEHSLIQTEYGWQGIVKSNILLGWELSGWEVLPGREELPGRVLCAEWRKGVVTRWWGVMSAICLSREQLPGVTLLLLLPLPGDVGVAHDEAYNDDADDGYADQ